MGCVAELQLGTLVKRPRRGHAVAGQVQRDSPRETEEGAPPAVRRLEVVRLGSCLRHTRHPAASGYRADRRNSRRERLWPLFETLALVDRVGNQDPALGLRGSTGDQRAVRGREGERRTTLDLLGSQRSEPALNDCVAPGRYVPVDVDQSKSPARPACPAANALSIAESMSP